MARVLIAGCGYVGTALAQRLARAGHQVWAVRRGRGALPTDVRGLQADLAEPTRLEAALGGLRVDYAVYCAAPDARDDAAYRRVYTDGLRNVIGLLRRGEHPLRRLLLTSSTSVYAQDDGEWVDETSATRPRRFSGRRVLEGEEILRGGGLPATAVRLAGIYGPGRASLVARVREGGGSRSGQAADAYTNRIHRDDAAGAIQHLIDRSERGEEVLEVYVGADCEPAPLSTVLAWIAERLGVPAPSWERDPRGRSGRNKRCRNERLVRSGYRFRYPSFREGYAPLVEEACRATPP